MEQQPTGFAEGLDKLQHEAVVHTSPLPAQQPRPVSSQSITGPITGERPCSRALSVMGADESQPQSTPPQTFESHLLQLSGPLFTEDRYSTSTVTNEESCDTGITTITQRWTPSQATTMAMSPPTRSVSTPSMADCSTQGDPDQMAPQGNHGDNQNNPTMPIQHTNNYLIPDGSNRHIHDIQDKTFHRDILENGHNAYLVELPDLKSLLCTSRYLMDEVTGQFYAVFGNSYQCMCAIPRLTHTWETGQLLDELAATRHAFGCMGPTGPAQATQINQPCLVDPVGTAYTEDLIPDFTTQKPPPRTVPHQPPSFNLDRATKCLTKEERLEVHHNYISAVSNLEHKKDLINRVKKKQTTQYPDL